MSRSLRVLLAAGTLLLIALLLVKTARRGGGRASSRSADAVSATIAQGSPSGAHGTGGAGGSASSTGTDDSGRPRHPAVDTYLWNTRYPPGSGRLERHMQDLLTPNMRHERPLPLDPPENPPPGAEAGEYHFLFTGDKYTLTGDEVVHLELQVTLDGKRIPITILGAGAVAETEAGALGPGIPIAFSPTDARYLAVLAPATAFPEHHGRIVVTARFEYAPGATYEAGLRVYFTPRKKVPARFTGQFSDALVDGSLHVEIGVEVLTPGFYVLDANLFDSRDEPVAWTRFKGNLAPGDTVAPMLFFGKIIRDANAAPPFVLKQLRGYRHVTDGVPDRELMDDYAGTYTTGDYRLEDFSEAEWDSEDRRRTADFLQSEADRGVEHPLPAADRPAPAPEPAP